MFDQILRSFTILPVFLAVSLIGGSAHSNAMMQSDEPMDPPAEEPVEEPTADPSTEPATADAPATAIPAEQFAATAAQSHDLDMAMHFILIGKGDMTKASIQALFDSQITDEQIAQLVDEKGIREKFERSLIRGRGMDGAAELVAELESR